MGGGIVRMTRLPRAFGIRNQIRRDMRGGKFNYVDTTNIVTNLAVVTERQTTNNGHEAT